MNQYLKTIQDILKENNRLTEQEKEKLLKAIADANKQWEIIDFKLDRTEKVKRTTTILLEETIAELENKRKAVEEQNRELEIESSLEKVRTVAMGMRKRDDMLDICRIMSEQLELLGIKEIRNVQTAIFYEHKGTYINYEYYRLHDKALVTEVDYTNDEISVEFAAQMIKGEDEVYVRSLEGQQVKDWLNVQKTTNVFIDTNLENARSLTYYWFSLGPVAIGTSTYHPLSEEEIALFKRFRNVFDLAYRRYLDIEKAEAQAREAQIEAALEKVRSRSLAMHKSDELESVVTIVFEKLRELDVVFDGGVGIYIFSEGSKNSIIWVASPDHFSSASCLNLPYQEDNFKNNPILSDIWTAREKGIDFYIRSYSFEEKNIYFKYLFEHNEYDQLPAHVRTWLLATESYTHSVALVKNSAMVVNSWTGQLLSENENEILKRFSRVFEQAYIRFLDLQKAEAQAREAQIQLALERVRAKTMAMHKSDELADVAELLFKQVNNLGIKAWTTGFNVWSDDNNFYTDYITSPQGNLIKAYTIDATEFSAFTELSDAKKRGDEFLVQYLEGDRLKETYKRLNDFGNEKQYEKMLEDGFEFPSHQYDHFVFGSKVSLMFITYNPVPEAHDIFKRFGKVFEQTYTRFLDLQKAEAQAREAQIEAALERVRSRTMAMQKSAELRDAAALLFNQIQTLGATSFACGFGIWGEDRKTSTLWMSQENLIQPPYAAKSDEDVFLNFYEAAQRGESLFVKTQEGEELKEHYKYMATIPVFKNVMEKMAEAGLFVPTFQILHSAFFVQGYLLFITYEPVPELWDVFKRFAKVFEQTYTRFLDLQRAEAQAREAQIEAALEKVRSRTLAMQRSDELAETASVLFKQLILLGIEPNRLYINIIKDETAEAESWITDEDGSKISMAYTANMNANPSFKKMYEGWRMQNKSLVIDMDGKELEEYFKHLSSLNVPFKGGLSQKRRLQYIAYFSKGFIGMASPDEQPKETMQLLERFAAVFNLTFTRFNDLKIAEAHALQAEQDLVEIKAAKKKAEDTLTELQATQKQLVQSEKMASLGELTAGIAHEIQNPLNFVNNFSDVSNELLEEMKTELEKGNTKDAIAIVDDVKQNLEKILHHGKRADAIVKGMLQHSRTSSSQKELTDINALADEYLRLAYHGLRAKDKSFNASMKTDFDETIGKIDIVPQDIGRAVLNLITNAFYVVAEKKRQLPEGYEPTVAVTTKKEGDKVFVSVKDNGNGIPRKVLEKIFQPFFTTKPTGQGTGLGLSLAYDIVKAHGGEIKVETKEGVGSEFIIQLPVV